MGNLRMSLLIAMVFSMTLGLKMPEEKLEKVWVFFTDKDTTSYNPYTFLDPLAIERRVLEGINVYDVTDVPVNASYVKIVENITQNNRAVSRWFNAVCCLASESQIEQIRALSFVRSVKITEKPLNLSYAARMQKAASEVANFDLDQNQIDFLKAQVERMSGQTFKNSKVDGKGIRVAIFDVGFKSYLTNPAFEHIRKENRVIKTYDFVKNKVYTDEGGTHGCFVMSCIGGRIKGVDIGMATGAQFLLARTETWTEWYSEEENWLEAAEWADKNGAHIINSSLGYTYHRYFTEDMDGEQSLVARAANLAARKGILVVNSAGNEGSGKWKIIGTPADADSVLSIGGINPETGIHTSFSSFGPTRDKRLKPNVTAYGHVIGSGPKGISETQGTSFSSPLTAGFAACAKQIRPTYGNMQFFREMEKSGDLYPYFDYAHGYGVPQATYFFKMPVQVPPTFKIETSNAQIFIRLKAAEVDGLMPIDTAGTKIGDRYTSWPNYVFYHIENSKGYLDKYFVVNPYSRINAMDVDNSAVSNNAASNEGPLTISKSDYARPYILRVYYKGYFKELLVK